MNDLLHKIEALERQIQEKEHELLLIKDDLESVRSALETLLEQQQSSTPEPSPRKNTVEPDQTKGEEREEQKEPEPEAEEVSEEQQHLAIMRTIEEFSRESAHSASGQSQFAGSAKGQSTLGDKMGSRRLSDLKKAFGINERFLYANELFDGDLAAFTQAIEELNHLESGADAERLLQENLSARYKWDEENETVIAFKSIVSRRFA